MEMNRNRPNYETPLCIKMEGWETQGLILNVNTPIYT